MEAGGVHPKAWRDGPDPLTPCASGRWRDVSPVHRQPSGVRCRPPSPGQPSGVRYRPHAPAGKRWRSWGPRRPIGWRART